jgi:tetratricopeptide (TPR) repeat protein
MTRKSTRLIALLSFVAVIATTGLARGQKEMPLFLDARPGEDPLLIDVTEMTQRYPKPAVQHYQKAVDDARKGRHTSAVAHLEETLRLAPEFFSAHNSLGILYQRLTRYRDAEREYNEARRLNSRSAAPLVNLGSLHIEESGIPGVAAPGRRRMLNEALASLNAALEIQPSSASGRYLTGVVYYLTGVYEEAEAHFQLALDFGLRASRLALANVYQQIQAWDDVVIQLDAYLRENRFASNRPWIEEARDEAAQRIGDRRR